MYPCEFDELNVKCDWIECCELCEFVCLVCSIGGKMVNTRVEKIKP